MISVVDLGEGRFRIVASQDVRADLAHVAVASGLLELSASRALEDTYLKLTGAE